MKAMLTWKGEEESNTRFNEWRGVKYEAGKAVETTDPHVIAKAATNPFYELKMLEGEEPKPLAKLPSETPAPPSQTSAQAPAEKPGEPAAVTAAQGAPRNPTLPSPPKPPQPQIKRPGA